jgi:hypothetical protein
MLYAYSTHTVLILYAHSTAQPCERASRVPAAVLGAAGQIRIRSVEGVEGGREEEEDEEEEEEEEGGSKCICGIRGANETN